MPLQSLSAQELEDLRGCLAFIARTPQLEGEFDTRLGVTRSEFEEIIMRWPAVSGNIADLAISNSLNELVNGLRLSAAEWTQIGLSHQEVSGLQNRWLSIEKGGPSGRAPAI